MLNSGQYVAAYDAWKTIKILSIQLSYFAFFFLRLN